MRAPWIRRESSSRPRLSVPSQCSALGGARLARKSASVGLWIGSTSAKMASSRTNTIQPAASTKPTPIRRRRTGATTGSGSAISSASMPDPRIEQRVQHVDDEIDDDEAGRDEQHDALQD